MLSIHKDSLPCYGVVQNHDDQPFSLIINIEKIRSAHLYTHTHKINSAYKGTKNVMYITRQERPGSLASMGAAGCPLKLSCLPPGQYPGLSNVHVATRVAALACSTFQTLTLQQPLEGHLLLLCLVPVQPAGLDA